MLHHLTSDSSLRDERLPKGPRFASESLDADTGSTPFSLKMTHYRPRRSSACWVDFLVCPRRYLAVLPSHARANLFAGD